MINDASEIECRAIREIGKMILIKRANGELRKKGQSYHNSSRTGQGHEIFQDNANEAIHRFIN